MSRGRCQISCAAIPTVSGRGPLTSATRTPASASAAPSHAPDSAAERRPPWDNRTRGNGPPETGAPTAAAVPPALRQPAGLRSTAPPAATCCAASPPAHRPCLRADRRGRHPDRGDAGARLQQDVERQPRIPAVPGPEFPAGGTGGGDRSRRDHARPGRRRSRRPSHAADEKGRAPGRTRPLSRAGVVGPRIRRSRRSSP